MKKIALLSIAAISLILACKKEKVDVQVATFTKNKISGVSQKGPFVNGSSLSIFELDNSFAQTGKVFNTQIVDNLGSFEVNNLSLQTQYACRTRGRHP